MTRQEAIDNMRKVASEMTREELELGFVKISELYADEVAGRMQQDTIRNEAMQILAHMKDHPLQPDAALRGLAEQQFAEMEGAEVVQ